MRQKYSKRMAVMFLFLVVVFADTVSVFAEKAAENSAEENQITIASEEAFLTFAQNCSLDVYSVGKVVELTADLDLTGTSFEGIPYFNGIFNGNGHTINGLSIEKKGSALGFFRYIGESGIVSGVKVYGKVLPEGSKECIGGIAGVNYGMIKNCTFNGTVCGIEAVGGIAGKNKSTGQILNCTTNAIVMATDNTGGIAGVNEGIVNGCTSKSQINIEELETVLDLGGIDIGTMNFTQSVVNRNNMGGIAGNSSGIIKHCKNYGTIGYAHTGYNVGGIAGSQKGLIIASVNEGKVYGRKDVGGIVGQAEPYIASEYLSDQIAQTREDINRMQRTLNNLSASMNQTSAQAEQYVNALTEQYVASSSGIKERTDQIKDAVSQNHKEAQQYTETINQAMKRIEEIQKKDGALTEEDIAEIQRNMEIIDENMEKLQKLFEASVDTSFDSMKDYANNLSQEMNAEEAKKNLNGLSDTLKAGTDAIADSIDKLNAQTETMLDHFESYGGVLRGEEAVVVDVSSIKTASEMDGVIAECINRGTIEGDLNVGGIAGTMNVEYGNDPEDNLSLAGNVDVTIRSEVNDVLISCENYGKVNGKKNYAGSITGWQEFGFIYACEGYGPVKVSAGNYIGGIAGLSNGRIENCYSMTDLTGNSYIGGIAGEGTTIVSCISAAKIDSDGEYLGGVLGSLKTDGSLEQNYFVKDTYDAVDNISYSGSAQPITYEELAQREELPKGFTEVCITYEVDGTVIAEKMIPYGSSLSEADFPKLEARANTYVAWPDEEVYTNIRNNLTICAEYIPWTQSLASAETADNGKPVFLAAAEFYEGTGLLLSRITEIPDLEEGIKLCYAYDWEIVSEKEKTFAQVEGHFYKPDTKGSLQVWYQENGSWILAESAEDGSYLTAQLPYGAAFAVTEKPETDSLLSFEVGAAVGLVLVISLFIVHNKQKKKGKKQK